jgi:hypothetical protein
MSERNFCGCIDLAFARFGGVRNDCLPQFIPAFWSRLLTHLKIVISWREEAD